MDKIQIIEHDKYAKMQCDYREYRHDIAARRGAILDRRGRILEQLAERQIQASNYFPPVHLQPFIAEQLGHKKGDFPVAESVSERTIALPFYNNLPKSQVEIVCKTLKELL